MTVTLDGFSKFVSQNIELHVAEVLAVDATLQAGRITDEVTVTAAATSVDSAPQVQGRVLGCRATLETIRRRWGRTCLTAP